MINAFSTYTITGQVYRDRVVLPATGDSRAIGRHLNFIQVSLGVVVTTGSYGYQ